MGVLGLWELLHPAGQPIPVESLENKVLAVDISIWLNQAVKGFRDRTGNAVPNAHLLGLYHRLCKLLFYKIKPVFVFDGQPPQLKRDTLIRRRMRKSKDARKARSASAKILDNYLKSQAISQKLKRQTHAIENVAKKGTEGLQSLLNNRTSEKEKDLFELPELPESSKSMLQTLSDDEEYDPELTQDILANAGVKTSDIYDVDVESEGFKQLPTHMQYDVLVDMRERRKQNSWARMHQMPAKAENFSSFQLERLKHRRRLQETLSTVSESLSNEQAEAVHDDALFVGDMDGIRRIKSELKRFKTQSGSTMVLASGLREAGKSRLELEAEKLRLIREKIKVEKMENPDSDPDDPEVLEAVMLSLKDQDKTATEEPSQEEIYQMIKSEYGAAKDTSGAAKPIEDDQKPSSSKGNTGMATVKEEPPDFLDWNSRKSGNQGNSRGSGSKVISDDEDDEIELLPGATIIFSNRAGGSRKGTSFDGLEIKQEPKDILDEEGPSSSVAPKNSSSGPSIMTPSGARLGSRIAGSSTVGRRTTKATAGSMPRSPSLSDDSDVEQTPAARSESESSDDDVSVLKEKKDVGDDLFADIFASEDNVMKLDEILGRTQPPKQAPITLESSSSSSEEEESAKDKRLGEPAEDNPAVNNILDEVSRLDNPNDIFAVLARKATSGNTVHRDPQKLLTKPLESKSSKMGGKQRKNKDDLSSDEEESSNLESTMRNSQHLYMKIAARHVGDAAKNNTVDSPPKSAAATPPKAAAVAAKSASTGSPFRKNLSRELTGVVASPSKRVKFGHVANKHGGQETKETDLELEQSRLLKEMEESEKARRLLRFTQLKYDEADVESEEDMDVVEGSEDRALQRLGIQALDSDRYRKKVLEDEGLVEKKKKAAEKRAHVTTPSTSDVEAASRFKRPRGVASSTVSQTTASASNSPEQPQVEDRDQSPLKSNTPSLSETPASKAKPIDRQATSQNQQDPNTVEEIDDPTSLEKSEASALQTEEPNEGTVKDGQNGIKGNTKDQSEDQVIYSSSAPGFVTARPQRGPQANAVVIDVGKGGDIAGGSRESLPEFPGIPSELRQQESDSESDDELYAIQAELARENQALASELGKADRLAHSITDQMYSECQELLQLFGVPWVVSPTEAEAQCAFLDENGLTHGTITDDSDIWLFGGKKVYKNFFNQEKFVEYYNFTEVKEHFGLERDKLILLAMLTGSDYTDGLEGVGPVTALEVLAEFPGTGIQPLQDFRSWWDRVRQEFGADFGMPVGSKVREKLRKLRLPNGFPNEAIMKAYLEPTIDTSLEKFSWTVPNLLAARDFAQDKFGWGKLQIDEILKPVARSLQQRNQTQSRIDNFITSYRTHLSGEFMKGSKRVEEALRRVKGLKTPEKEDSTAASKKRGKLAVSPRGGSTNGGKLGAVTSTAQGGQKKSAVDKKKRGARAQLDSPLKVDAKVAKKSGNTGQDFSVASGSQPAGDDQQASGSKEKEPEVSLIARSCGIIINPSRDDIILQRIERERRSKEARARAAEIFKKCQENRDKKTQKKFKRPSRVVLTSSVLSESDSD